jgi:hypothetical protein
MPDWVHLALQLGTLLLFIGILAGLVIWLFGSGRG